MTTASSSTAAASTPAATRTCEERPIGPSGREKPKKEGDRKSERKRCAVHYSEHHVAKVPHTSSRPAPAPPRTPALAPPAFHRALPHTWAHTSPKPMHVDIVRGSLEATVAVPTLQGLHNSSLSSELLPPKKYIYMCPPARAERTLGLVLVFSFQQTAVGVGRRERKHLAVDGGHLVGPGCALVIAHNNQMPTRTFGPRIIPSPHSGKCRRPL